MTRRRSWRRASASASSAARSPGHEPRRPRPGRRRCDDPALVDESAGLDVGDHPHRPVDLQGLGVLVVVGVLLALGGLRLGVLPVLGDDHRDARQVRPLLDRHRLALRGAHVLQHQRPVRLVGLLRGQHWQSLGPQPLDLGGVRLALGGFVAQPLGDMLDRVAPARGRARSRRSAASGSCSNSAKIAASSKVRSPDSSRLRVWSALVTARAAFTVGRSMEVRLAICAALTPIRANCSTPATISVSRIPARWMFSTIWSPIRSASSG